MPSITPSWIKVRRYKGRPGYPASLGYYFDEYKFEPLIGEPLAVSICVRPDEIEEVDPFAEQ